MPRAAANDFLDQKNNNKKQFHVLRLVGRPYHITCRLCKRLYGGMNGVYTELCADILCSVNDCMWIDMLCARLCMCRPTWSVKGYM